MIEMSEHPLGYLLFRVMAVLRPAVTAELGPLGLTLPAFVCLRALSLFGGRSSAELARDACVSPQAMNYVLLGLQEMGAVTRPESVSSGRARPAHLTAEGSDLLQRAEAAVARAEGEVLAELAVDERAELKRLLWAVRASD